MAAKIWSHGVIHHTVARISRVLRVHLYMDSSLNAADKVVASIFFFVADLQTVRSTAYAGQLHFGQAELVCIIGQVPS